MAMSKQYSPCQHCHQKPGRHPRGLCWNCYYVLDVRHLYPSTSKFANRGVTDTHSQRSLPAAPTTATPGTLAKVEVLVERAAAGTGLWHPYDATLETPITQWEAA